MGNRAKRVELARALKSHGLGKLYKGSKQAVFKSLDALTMDRTIRFLQFKPGDLVNDCDAFNHVVKSVRADVWRHKYKIWVNLPDQFEFEDGRWSCGCPGGPAPAWSREQVEAYFKLYTPEIVEERKKGGWWSDRSQRMYDRIQAGGHVCDERGICLPEFSDQ